MAGHVIHIRRAPTSTSHTRGLPPRGHSTGRCRRQTHRARHRLATSSNGPRPRPHQRATLPSIIRQHHSSHSHTIIKHHYQLHRRLPHSSHPHLHDGARRRKQHGQHRSRRSAHGRTRHAPLRTSYLAMHRKCQALRCRRFEAAQHGRSAGSRAQSVQRSRLESPSGVQRNRPSRDQGGSRLGIAGHVRIDSWRTGRKLDQ